MLSNVWNGAALWRSPFSVVRSMTSLSNLWLISSHCSWSRQGFSSTQRSLQKIHLLNRSCPSIASKTSRRLIWVAGLASVYPRCRPRYDFNTPCWVSRRKILARKYWSHQLSRRSRLTATQCLVSGSPGTSNPADHSRWLCWVSYIYLNEWK